VLAGLRTTAEADGVLRVALRCCVLICTTRSCLRAAFTIARPSAMLTESGFST
jgi:hypothetical protein